MSRLADPTICPDCRAALDAAGTCPDCGLRLRGPVAAELWQTMLTADRLVSRLRQAATVPPATPAPASVTSPPAPVPSPPVPSTPVPPTPAPAPAPAPYPSAPPRPDEPASPRRGLAAASVPVVLLSLGGLCLVVFAAIFLGVAWDVLGLWGRSLVMLVLTLLLGLSAVLVTVRGLRASAETLWLVVGVTLALDLYAASAADLLVTDLSGRWTSSVVGAALLVLGAAAAAWARRTPCRTLVTPQVVAVLGVAALSVAQLLGRDDPAPAAAVLVGVLLAVAWVLERLRLPWSAAGSLLLAVGAWLLLVVVESVSAGVDDDPGWLWWWGLVVAAAYAAAVAQAPRRLLAGRFADGTVAVARSVAATGALVALLLLVTSPAVTDSPDLRALLAAAGQLLLLALLVLAATVWARAAAPLAVLGSLGLVGALLGQAGGVVRGALLDGAVELTPGARLAPAGDVHPLVWLVHGVVAALSVAALVGVRGPGLLGVHADGRARGDAGLRQDVAVSAGVAALALGGWDAVLATGVPLWAAVLAGLLAAGATGWSAWWFRQRPAAAVLASGATLWVGGLVTWLALASGSELLIAMVLTALAVPVAAAGVARDRAGATVSGALLLGLAVLVGAGALHQWGTWLGADSGARALVLAAYAAALLLAARVATRQPASRLTLELAAVPLTLAALATVGDADGALVLTVVGTAVAVSSVWQRDRATLGWLALAVGLLALLWRGLAGLEAPELASLPIGAVLLVGGALRLRRDPELGSATALGPGLALSLAPSLLLCLPDPVSVRGALVAAGSLAALAVGVLGRLSAPFVVGALATGLLVLRHLGPVADAVPRWMAIGLVGAVLLVAGITWEAGLRNLSRARRYVVSLR
ncbi:SCO7613 C-terminal domain-containing membrane protein [Nocardioides aequoreus]|uniref:SCO7613 C-terminal domain-containing membrane protein n=1 Tax=Nocardioides aequoreus TaxID=397278 RepID=UPI0004C3C1B6|nr:hypothetical protein [Nocardioides aequoreus]